MLSTGAVYFQKGGGKIEADRGAGNRIGGDFVYNSMETEKVGGGGRPAEGWGFCGKRKHLEKRNIVMKGRP